MYARIIFSVIIFICALVSYAYFSLWRGGFAGKNYMRNEFDIKDEDIDDQDNYYNRK